MCQTFWFAILATLCRFSKGKDLVPADIVTWDKPNGALIRTEVVIQGGVLRVPGNGKFSGTSVQYDNGSLFKLDLNEPFDINNGGKPPRFEAMNDNGMKIGTTAQDGWMFADYDEYYVYGYRCTFPLLKHVILTLVQWRIFRSRRRRYRRYLKCAL